MDNGVDITTDAQIMELMKNSNEPVVVETTTTTTTTTTVTKRICISNDANIDITDIRSLLNMGDTSNTNAITAPTQPNQADKTKIKKEKSAFDFELPKKSISNRNQTLLSSTKIDGLFDLDEKENKIRTEKKTKSHNDNFLSPNLSTIPSEKFFKTKEKNTNQSKKKVNNSIQPKMDAYSTRSKNASAKTEIKPTAEKKEYIDGLINEYITSERKLRRKDAKEPKASGKVKAKATENEEETKQSTPTAPQDLSAIFETSVERVASPPQMDSEFTTDFDDIGQENYNIDLDDDQFQINDAISAKNELKKGGNVKGTKTTKNPSNSKTSDKKPSRTDDRKVKKPTKISKTNEKAIAKKLQTIKTEFKAEPNKPIMIYSPSTRDKLKPSAGNKLILTKKMIEKKMQKHPNSSKNLLDRMGDCNEMTIDADTRLIYYPETNGDLNIEESEDIDLLDVLRKQHKGLLVKEYLC